MVDHQLQLKIQVLGKVLDVFPAPELLIHLLQRSRILDLRFDPPSPLAPVVSREAAATLFCQLADRLVTSTFARPYS